MNEPAPARSPLKQALLAIDDLQTRLAAAERRQGEPIAIVGIGCRLPGGVDGPVAYWDLLAHEIDAVGEVPSDRWDLGELYDADPDAPGKVYTRQGGFLADISGFDARFFGISPREATSLDPQQRLLLEVAWEALEHAGISPAHLTGSRTGVFVGVMENDYAKLHLREGGTTGLDAYYVTGNHFSFTAGRISYVLGLHGPSVALDTACSSSLVAIHLACQSLRSGESDLALAGGVNLMLSPELTITMCKFHALSVDGRCKTFDESADGFGQGEGGGIVVLKRLSDARAAGDNIVAVIRGSAVNHDGPSGGLTVPNGAAQQQVVSAALRNASVNPSDVGYVEAHGTGTSLGDPIEVRALGAVLGAGRTDDERLLLGSVKTNIGHLDSAAGVAGLIKVALSLQHGQIPAHLHLRSVNPRIDLDEIPVAIPTTMTPWPERGGTRIGGVSSFGLSGTNAHVILEQAPQVEAPTPSTRSTHILALSAKSDAALAALAARYADAVHETHDDDLADLVATANTGRSHFEHRLAVIAEGSDTMAKQLAAAAIDDPAGVAIRGRVDPSRSSKLAYLFTGQGAQYVGMAHRLYKNEPVVREILDRSDEILRDQLPVPLLSVIFDPERGSGRIDETMFTQPALFAVEYAVAALWRSWGFEPDVVMGHSVGEYAAAAIAGVVSFDDGLRLIAERGRLMQSLPKDGAMAVVFARRDQVEAALTGYDSLVSLGALNGPENIVVSGERAAVNAIVEALGRAGVRAQALNVSHAFHSPLMEPILDEFRRFASATEFAMPAIPMVSNLAGRFVDAGSPLDADYWTRQIRAPVAFFDGMRTLESEGIGRFIEVGPNPTLLGMGRRCLSGDGPPPLWLPSLSDKRDDCEQIYDSLGQLYVDGAEIDWNRVTNRPAFSRWRLPTYPFEHERYWIESSRNRRRAGRGGDTRRAGHESHPLLGEQLASPLRDLQFETVLDAADPEFLDDHRVHGTVVVPATCFAEMALAAAAAAGGSPAQLDDLVIHDALVLADDGDAVVQTILSPEGAGQFTARISSRSADGTWKLHASATASTGAAPSAPATPPAPSAGDTGVDVAAFYEQLRSLGLQYGPTFRGIVSARRANGDAVAEIHVPAAAESPYFAHPGVLDAALQLGLLLAHDGADGASAYLPVSLRQVAIGRQLPARVTAHARRVDRTSESIELDVSLWDETGAPLAQVAGLVLRKASQAALHRLGGVNLDDWLYTVEWEKATGPTPAADRSPRDWLIFDDGTAAGRALGARLAAEGQRCTFVARAGRAPGEPLIAGAHTLTADPSSADDLDRAVAAWAERATAPAGAVYLWDLDDQPRDAAARPSVPAASLDAAAEALHAYQALTRHEWTSRLGLWLVTRGAAPVGEHLPMSGLIQSPLWGLGASIASEHPEFRCVLIDLDPQAATDDVDALTAEILAESPETRVAVRGDGRHLARLQRSRFGDHGRSPLPVPSGTAFELAVGDIGHLDSLRLEPTTRREPGPGEVEIDVQAAGLNFKDVLKVLGRFPLEGAPLGDECAGYVAAVGPGVTGLAVGDRVVAMATGALRSHVIAKADLVARIPDALSFEHAAGIPIVWLTAAYALQHLTTIGPGSKVLIHAGAGGVGLAAVELALRAGAEVFATAGSPHKRAVLRDLGVAHVMDSRTLDFADEIRRITDGRGVDVVLNSLAGEWIDRSLAVVARDGAFIEIGRAGIWTAEQVAAMRPDIAYHPFYLGDVADRDPHLIGALLAGRLDELAREGARPLPSRAFALSAAPQAFEFMARARHIGKLVISFERRDTAVRADGTYLVTGGLGGIGLEVAKWLAAQGAQSLVLLGRRGATGDAVPVIDELERSGVQVMAAAVDVSDRDALDALLTRVRASMPPLRGVLHAAAVLDDGVLRHQSRARLAHVFAPKVEGAWNLHTLTADDPLDFFVLFSSWAAVVGLPGQGNYIAANAFLEALAHHRSSEGSPALVIDWGAWASVGLAASMAERDRQRLADIGLALFEPELGIMALERLIDDDRTQAAVFAIDWARYADYFKDAASLPFLSALASEVASRRSSGASDAVDVARALREAAPQDRRKLVETKLSEMAAKVLRIPVARIDLEQPLAEMGLDSLMSTELFAQIERGFGVRLPLSTLIEAPSVHALAGVLDVNVDEPSHATVSWQALVPIKATGTRTPVFVVHAEEGNVLFYRDLARHLDPDQPLYALQGHGLDGSDIGRPEIESMAAHYIEAVRTVQPHGPYQLGGFCLGGALALEMARQLVSSGETVASVTMIQTSHHRYLTAQRASLPGRIGKLVDRVDYERFRMAKLPAARRLPYLAFRAKRARTVLEVKANRVARPLSDRFGRTLPHSADYHLEALANAYSDAFWRYTPGSYDGRVVVVRASRQPRGVEPDELMGWDEIIPRDSTVVDVDAYHQTIMEEPAVIEVARVLTAEAARARADD